MEAFGASEGHKLRDKIFFFLMLVWSKWRILTLWPKAGTLYIPWL